MKPVCLHYSGLPERLFTIAKEPLIFMSKILFYVRMRIIRKICVDDEMCSVASLLPDPVATCRPVQAIGVC